MVIGLGEFPVGHLAETRGPGRCIAIQLDPSWQPLVAGEAARQRFPYPSRDPPWKLKKGAYDSLWRVTPCTTAWCHYKHRLHSDHINASRWRPSSKNQLATWHLHVGPNPGVLVDADAVGAYRASRNYGKHTLSDCMSLNWSEPSKKHPKTYSTWVLECEINHLPFYLEMVSEAICFYIASSPHKNMSNNSMTLCKSM